MRRHSLIGQTIADRFNVLELLGEGGMGEVYLCEHAVLERKFALKVLRKDMVEDKMAAERFRREARAASRMQHRNIVYISDFGQLMDGRLFLVMEYIPGEGLDMVVAREGKLPPDRAAGVLMQVADALDYAHEQGVVHRDLKSENILLTLHRRRRDVVKILDFGLAKILSGAGSLGTITSKGQIFGTPEYMSPEQIMGEEVDGRTDIYALGVLCFELIAGRTPFTGSLLELLVAHRKMDPPRLSDSVQGEDVPAVFDEIVERCLQKTPQDRFPRAGEIVTLLSQFLRDQGVRSISGSLEAELAAQAEAAVAEEPQESEFDRKKTAEREALPTPTGEMAALEPLSETVQRKGGPVDEGQRRWLRQRFRRCLHDIAQLLRDRDLGSADLTVALTKSFELEEKTFEQETELALLESRLEEIEASGRERESRLRYAIIDLGIEKGKLEDPASAAKDDERTVLPDLVYQIGELERRLSDVAKDREKKLNEIDRQMADHRRVLDDLRSSLARQDATLLDLVVDVRPEIGGSNTLGRAYEMLDDLMRQLPPPSQAS